MIVYVIKVTPEASFSKVSQEGYRTYDEARAFIESRAKEPLPLSNFIWRDEDDTDYEIVEVKI